MFSGAVDSLVSLIVCQSSASGDKQRDMDTWCHADHVSESEILTISVATDFSASLHDEAFI
jgi:hypothetical protein